MVVLLQGYVGASDAEAVELAMMDLRWQMVLDCMGADDPPFSQGALQAFRERLIAHEMDRELLERTVALVRAGTVSDRDGKALTKAVRVALDSRPLAGAGRVEDTINLLGHAARSIVRLVKKLTGSRSEEDICRKAGVSLLLAPSIKAGLDIDWSDPKQKVAAIEIVEYQVSSLERWVERHLDEAVASPLTPYIEALAQVRRQDLETRDGTVRIRRGVAAERRISIEDPEMRHGRKSKSQRINGYKEHVARDLDLPAILAVAVTPANRPEEEGAAPIYDDIRAQGFKLVELNIDRAYVNSPVVYDVLEAGGDIRAKAWGQRPRLPGMLSKRDFHIDARTQTITCPEGRVEPFEPGMTVEFDPEICGACPRRAQCTTSASGRGRTISIADDEGLQQKLRGLQRTTRGRQHLRERVQVEHALAHVAARKGNTARYLGVRRNLFDLRRAAAIQNLEAVHRLSRAA